MKKKSDHLPAPRPEIEDLRPVHHGAPDHLELESLGLTPDQVLDFSVNSSPFGPSPRVRKVLQSVPLDRYPDREALQFRRLLSRRLDIEVDRILAGNGTAELLWLVSGAYLTSDSRVLVLQPTFGEYARSARWMGAEVIAWTARSEDHFQYHPEMISGLLKSQSFQIVYICNPNNPTGQLLAPQVISAWAAAHPRTLFLIDEAYLGFTENAPTMIGAGHSNLLILRSMTKDYALAGLRLGYAVGSQEVISTIRKIRPPWNVNALAQAAGCAALQDASHLQESIQKIRAEKRFLVRSLKTPGFSPLPSAAHYFLLRVGNGAAFRTALLEDRIQVRDCASFGIPEFVRIAPRTRPENERLVEAAGRYPDKHP